MTTYPSPTKAIIPVRGISESMSRLRKKLDDKLVDEIVYRLLLNTTNLVKQSNIEPIILTSDKDLSKKNGIHFKTIIDDGTSLNQAVSDGVQEIGEELVLFIMPDLPGLNSTTLNKFISLQQIHKYVIAPTHDFGTAIACLPNEIYGKHLFGKNSATLFIDECNSRKVGISVLETETIAHDLDTMEDWERWKEFMLNKFLQKAN